MAAYARVSCGSDAMLQSLSAQVSYYSAFIQKRRDWEYVGVYADEAETGTKDSRGEFQRMLADCRVGKVDIILTKSVSRFARNTVTLLETVRELKLYGVDVWFERENIKSLSGNGELMLTILASFAQEESRSASENVKWRIRKKFEKGEPNGMRLMYGFNVADGVVTVNEEQADVIRMIFSYYIGGMGSRLIANKLNSMNIPAYHGGPWNQGTIINIIQNEKMIGDSRLQKQFVTDHLSKKTVENTGQLPQYYVVGTHPAIVEKDVFEKAQIIMKERARDGSGKRDWTHPFRQKIVCSTCGGNYIRRAANYRTLWMCGTYAKYGKSHCNAKAIPEQVIMDAATKLLKLDEFDATAFRKNIKEIRAASDTLTFIFIDGREEICLWQYPQRRWTPEMRERMSRIKKEGCKKCPK